MKTLVIAAVLLAVALPAPAQVLTEVPGCREEFDLVTASSAERLSIRNAYIVAVAGHHAYVAGAIDSEFAVVDFSDPDNPVEVATVPTPRSAVGLAVGDGYLLAAIPYEGLYRYDLADPALPVEDLVLPLDDGLQDLALEGDIAYLALGDAGVMGVTLEHPGFMLPLPAVNTGGYVHALTWHGDRLYLADGDNGLVVFDATDPADLQFLGTAPFPGEASTVTAGFDRVAAGGVSNRSPGCSVVLYGAEGPGLPSELASRDFEGSTAYVPRPLLRTADRLLLTRTGEDIAVTEFVHQGQELLTHGRSGLLGNLGLVDTGEWLLGVDGSVSVAPAGGLAAYALAEFDAFSGRAVHQGEFLYSSTGSGLRIVDVSDPFDPVERSALPLTNVLSSAPIAANGPFVYLGRNGPGIQVVLVADPTAPVALGFVNTDAQVTALLREGDFLYAAIGSDGLQVFDVSTSMPLPGGKVPHTDEDGAPPVMAKRHDQLFVSNPAGGARIYDVADPGAPDHVEDFGLGILTAMAFTEDGRLLTGYSGFEGIVSYAEDPQGHWTLAGPSPGEGTVRQIMVEGELAYTVEGVLAVYDLTANPFPVMKHHFEAGIGTLPILVSFGEEIMSVAANQGILLHAKPCSDGISAVPDDGTPTVRLLEAPWPNPFNPRTNLAFDLPRAGDVQLAVHDLRGRRLRTLWSGPAPAGINRVVWDGTDDSGRQVAAGVYLVRIVSGRQVEHRKVALIK